MKNQMITILTLLVGLNTQAQMDLPDLSLVKVQESSDTINFTPEIKNQVFIHGQDSIFLELNCSSGELTFLNKMAIPENGKVQIVDSIDLNDDGMVELILYREWSCYSPGDITNEFGVGSSSENNVQYEVWDVKNHHKLLEFKSSYRYQYIVSTNVVHGSSYNYDVSFDAKGNMHFVQTSGLREGEENKGTYKYDQKSGVYILK